MIESEEVKFRKRRSSQEIRRLVTEFEASGLRQLEFCKSRGLALSTLQRGLKRRRTETEGQGESQRGRIGNCRKCALLEAFEKALKTIEHELEAGETLIELY